MRFDSNIKRLQTVFSHLYDYRTILLRLANARRDSLEPLSRALTRVVYPERRPGSWGCRVALRAINPCWSEQRQMMPGAQPEAYKSNVAKPVE